MKFISRDLRLSPRCFVPQHSLYNCVPKGSSTLALDCLILQMGPQCCPETSIINYQCTLQKNPKSKNLTKLVFKYVLCNEIIGYATSFCSVQNDLINSTKLIRVFYLCRGVLTMAVQNSGN